ncbi:hypothetical protein NI18_09920 [Sphingomonas sp. Ant20]|nr:hypothetical protein NI18_09920 [Sphingomonas sp. Ant20]
MQAALGALVLGGCTTTHLQTGVPAAGKITQGAVYNLPEVHYDVEVRRTLVECPLAPDDAHPSALGKVVFEVRAGLAARTVAGEEVAIDYAALADFMKISDFGYERYPSGILKSVNVTVDDRTADVAAEAFKAAISVGKIAIGVPGGGAVAAEAVPTTAFLACSDTAAQALAELPRLRGGIKVAEASLKKAKKARDDFASDHQEAQRSPEVSAKAADLQRDMRLASETASDANEAAAKAVSQLTLVSRRVYEPGETLRSEADALADATADSTKPQDVVVLRTLEKDQGNPRWLVHRLGRNMALAQDRSSEAAWVSATNEVERTRAIAAAQGYWSDDATARRDALGQVVAGLTQAQVVIVSGPLTRRSTALQLPAAPTCGAPGAPRCGIVYRTRAQGRVRVCRPGGDAGLPDDRTCLEIAASDDRVLASDERAIPQLGHLASLGLTNGPFSNNVLTAEFAEDGSLVKFGYRKPRAEAVAIGQTINGGLDAATSLIAYGKGSELRTLAAEKAENDARAALLTSAIPLKQPSEQTKIENETRLLEAERKHVEEEILLRRKRQELKALDATEGSSD